MLGVPDAIHIATYHMLMTVKDQSDRPCHDRPYRPEYAISMTSSSSNSSSHNLSSSSNSSSSSYYGSSSNSSSSQYGSSSGSGSHHHGYESSGNTNSNHHHHHSHQPHHHNGNASSGSGHWPLETRTFHCPSDKVGPMIGKGGNRINRIRMDTGCKITIEEASDERGDRPFVITGTARDVDLAMRALEGYLRREFSRDQEKLQLQQQQQQQQQSSSASTI
ncbi:RNA binding protein, heterogenous nuclear RNP-K like protein [Coelomomyces lativittatus]|nr:RNA binding protein, heterogenous nuclear RNP-K like protein [Coelomomyces lativittatus]